MFNQTIKENVLYGEPSATDADVRRVCEQANALSFIESNFEELDKEQRAEVSRKDLSDKLESLMGEHPELAALKVFVDQEEHCEALNQVLKKADKKFYDCMTKQVSMFADFFQEIGIAKGNKWDDTVIKFEWHS